jgi:hypothetical protein
MMLFHMLRGAHRDQFTVADLFKLKISRQSPDVIEIMKIAQSEKKQWDVVKEVQRAIRDD